MSYPRFRAALPHELDNTTLTKRDLPVYIERVAELQAECEGRRQQMVDARDALACGDTDGAWKALVCHEVVATASESFEASQGGEQRG